MIKMALYPQWPVSHNGHRTPGRKPLGRNQDRHTIQSEVRGEAGRREMRKEGGGERGKGSDWEQKISLPLLEGRRSRWEDLPLKGTEQTIIIPLLQLPLMIGIALV